MYELLDFLINSCIFIGTIFFSIVDGIDLAVKYQHYEMGVEFWLKVFFIMYFLKICYKLLFKKIPAFIDGLCRK